MRRFLWVIVLLAAMTAVTVVAIPTLTIMPFKPQTTRTLEIAYPLKRDRTHPSPLPASSSCQEARCSCCADRVGRRRYRPPASLDGSAVPWCAT